MNERIGNNGTGTFNQNATSTNIVSDTLSLGFDSCSSGTYTMKGGYLQTVDESVGIQATKGTFTQKGGTHIISDNLTVGNSSTGNGTFNLLAGGLSAGNEIIGGFGTGQFTQSGGTNTVGYDFYRRYTSIGAYTLNGGQLQTVNETIGNNGTGAFTQNGGTNTVGGALARC